MQLISHPFIISTCQHRLSSHLATRQAQTVAAHFCRSRLQPPANNSSVAHHVQAGKDKRSLPSLLLSICDSPESFHECTQHYMSSFWISNCNLKDSADVGIAKQPFPHSVTGGIKFASTAAALVYSACSQVRNDTLGFACFTGCITASSAGSSR